MPNLHAAVITRSTRRSLRLENLFYAACFLPFFFLTRFVTILFVATRVNRLVRMMQRLSRRRVSVLYLDPFFPANAGCQYRTQKWIDRLRENGIEARALYVLERDRFEFLLREQRIIQFHRIFLRRRIWHCLIALRYHCVIVRRELLLFNDYGDLFLDKLLLAMHPNVVLDFDDDISAAKLEPRTASTFGRLMFENGVKFGDSLRLYKRFIVGSSYLANLLSERNAKVRGADVITVPTCVDYERLAPKVYKKSEYINFGWIGSSANHYLLEIITPVLNQLAEEHKLRLVVITGDDYLPRGDFEVVHIPWSLETEIDSLRRIDIGLMPLYDNPQERGKCGFKLIQYMGLGIVSIASAVTANCEIVDDGENGFLVYQQTAWLPVIESVLARREEFPKIGAAARDKIHRKFSFDANQEKYLDFVRAGIA